MLLVTGGDFDNHDFTTSTEILNWSENMENSDWKKGSNLPAAYASFSGVLLNNIIYVFGKYSGNTFL